MKANNMPKVLAGVLAVAIALTPVIQTEATGSTYSDNSYYGGTGSNAGGSSIFDNIYGGQTGTTEDGNSYLDSVVPTPQAMPTPTPTAAPTPAVTPTPLRRLVSVRVRHRKAVLTGGRTRNREHRLLKYRRERLLRHRVISQLPVIKTLRTPPHESLIRTRLREKRRR